MQIGKPFIVNLAGTGAIPTRSANPHVPLSHDEIVDDVAGCLEAGVQIVHLHARDADGAQTGDPEPYGRLIQAIRSLPGGRDLVICVTTTGRKDSSLELRSRVLELDGDAKPDMASLTLSSLNFTQTASINPPDTIRRLAQNMQARGIRPELEIFDLGMVNFAGVLMNEGLIDAPAYVNVLLGNIAGAQADPLQLTAMLSRLPADSVVTVAGLGRQQLAANALGLLAADGVRVGLEDNLWFDQARTVPASNATLVKRVIQQAALLERPLMTRAALRQRLGMPTHAG
jgi:3-keto-5-aminohexanoate cleavage enzyme